MIQNKDIINCLPLLASVLGDQYGVEVRIGGNEAKTNGKTIYLPALPVEGGAELLAQARGFLDHEAAHIRHTDFHAIKKANMDAVTFNLFNVIEDWRIEQRLSEIFPGCRQNFQWLIRRLFLEKQDGIDERAGNQIPALSVLSYVLLTVRAWELPELDGQVQNLKQILDDNFPDLRENLDEILARVRNLCPDSQSVIGYAQELAGCIRNWLPPMRQPENHGHELKTNHTREDDKHRFRDRQDSNAEKEASGNSLGDREPESHTPSDKDVSKPDTADTTASNAKGDSASSAKKPKQSLNTGETRQSTQNGGDGACSAPDSGSRPDQEHATGNGLESLFRLGPQDLPLGLGELLGSRLEQQNADCKKAPVTVAVQGDVKVNALSDEDMREAMRTTVALRTRLACLLQTRAQKHCQAARRGKLHPVSLYRLSVGNAKVFTKEAEQNGIDTAIHILLDSSGSMYGEPIRLAGNACYAIAKALENCKGISTGITAFPAYNQEYPGVCPLLEHGSRISSRFRIAASGSTPLAEALWWVMPIMLKRKEARKIIIILTDGRPTNFSGAIDALRQAARLGLELYGIGLVDNSIAALLPDRSRVIDRMDDLAPALFDMLGRCLAGSRENYHASAH